MSQEQFIEVLISRYPNGCAKLKSEIKSLKRKLDDVEFSDIDEEEYCKFADSIENKVPNKCVHTYECATCKKTFNRRENF
jgi:hypothetical protein